MIGKVGQAVTAFIGIVAVSVTVVWRANRDSSQTSPKANPVMVGGSPTKVITPGKQIGNFQIRSIDLKLPLFEGTNSATLQQGPGHYRTTPLPGESGNVGIACHRTTFGAPCFRLGELQPGAFILMSTKALTGTDKTFVYRIYETKVVNPNENEVLGPVADKDTLTITTCHPLYSSKQRLVIHAELV